MNHKLIMENWRRYEQYHDIFEDKEYITEFLGIRLPLNESGYIVYSDPLRQQIIREHLLLEGWFQSLKSYVADKAAPMKDLAKIMLKIMKEKNVNFMNAFMNSLNKNIIKPLKHKMLELLHKAKMPKVWGWIEKNVIKPVHELQGMRKLINFAALAVFMRMGYEKLSGLLGDLLSGALDSAGLAKIKETVTNWVKGVFAEPWEKVKEVGAKMLDFEKWAAAIGPVVGGVLKVADMLAPATKTFAKKAEELSDEDAAGRAACKASKKSPECREYQRSLATAYNRDEDEEVNI
tara:strand:+ start:151 stop:1023 length:873 start_codon:yes stop_codon:yes gene_type:complete